MTGLWGEAADDRLIHQLYQTVRVFSKTLNQTISVYGVYGSEWTLLNTIRHEEDCSQAELIQYLGVEPAAVSKTLTKMEGKGMISRELRPGSRGKFIRLTAKGEQLYQELSTVVAAHRRQALAGVSESERRQLELVMRQLQENLLIDSTEAE